MRNERHDEMKLFTPANYPALREFLPAYLHQDFMQEYGSAAEAAKAFVEKENREGGFASLDSDHIATPFEKCNIAPTAIHAPQPHPSTDDAKSRGHV